MNTDIQEIRTKSKPTVARIRLHGKAHFHKIMAYSTGLILLISGSSASAAPSNINVSAASRTVLYYAIGYSQVEYMWPESGVVCRNNKSSGSRMLRNVHELN